MSANYKGPDSGLCFWRQYIIEQIRDYTNCSVPGNYYWTKRKKNEQDLYHNVHGLSKTENTKHVERETN